MNLANRIAELECQADWASLARLWLVHGLHPPAMEAARGIVEERAASFGGPWAELVRFLKSAEANPADINNIPPASLLPAQAGDQTVTTIHARSAAPIPEFGEPDRLTTLLIALIPRLRLSLHLERYPYAKQQQLFRIAQEASQTCLSIAQQLGDHDVEEVVGWTITQHLQVWGNGEDTPIVEQPANASPERPVGNDADAIAGHLEVTTVSNGLRGRGESEDALQAFQDAVDTRRALVAREGESFLPKLAESLIDLSAELWESGRYDEALQPAEEAVRICSELVEKSNSYRPLLAIAFAGLSNDLSALGNQQEALRAVRKAADILGECIPDNRDTLLPAYAGVLDTLALQLNEVGLRQEALRVVRKALECCDELAPVKRDKVLPIMAGSLCSLSKCLGALGQRHEALQSAQQAVACYRELAGRRERRFLLGLATSLDNLATQLSESGQQGEAQPIIQEALQLYRNLGPDVPRASRADLAALLNNCGNCLSDLGRQEEALGPTQEAVNSYRELLRENRAAFLPGLATSLMNLSSRLSELGRGQEALPLVEESLEFYTELADGNRPAFLPNLAMCLNNQASTLKGLGRFREALVTAQKAAEIYRELVSRHQEAYLPNLAGTLCNLSAHLLDVHRMTEALLISQEALCLYRELSATNHAVFLPDLALSLHSVGLCFHEIRLWREANETYMEAAAGYNESARASPTSHLLWRQKLYLDLALLQRQRPASLGGPLYAEALSWLRESVRCAEEARNLAVSPLQRQHNLRKSLRSYELLYQTAIDVWDVDHNPEPLHAAISASEGSRHRRLLDLLADEALEPRAPPELVECWRELRRELIQARQAIHAASRSAIGGLRRTNALDSIPQQNLRASNFAPTYAETPSLDIPLIQEAQRRLDAAETAHAKILLQLQQHDLEFNPDQAIRAVGVPEVLAYLKAHPGTVIVSYFLTPAQGFALVLALPLGAAPSPSELLLHAVRLPELSTSMVLDLTRDWFEGYRVSSTLAQQQIGFTSWGESLPTKLLGLAAVALWPILRALGPLGLANTQKLLLCPHSFLHTFPFHACPLPCNPGDGPAQVLADRYQITYAPSLSMLWRCWRRDRSANAPALIVSNPTGDLDFTEIEGALHRHRLAGSTFLLHSQASVRRFLDEAPRHGRILYTGHAHTGDDPGQACLVFHGFETFPLISIYQKLKLSSCRDVVLNGCDSGLLLPMVWRDLDRQPLTGSDHFNTDSTDFEGLPMAFLFAGAQSVLGSLWSVHDISGALLIDRYEHERAKPGVSPGAALREAQRWLRQDIRNGGDLRHQVESLLMRVPSQSDINWDGLTDRIWKQVSAHQARCRNSPPFQSPVYWAPFFITGLAE